MAPWEVEVWRYSRLCDQTTQYGCFSWQPEYLEVLRNSPDFNVNFVSCGPPSARGRFDPPTPTQGYSRAKIYPQFYTRLRVGAGQVYSIQEAYDKCVLEPRCLSVSVLGVAADEIESSGQLRLKRRHLVTFNFRAISSGLVSSRSEYTFDVVRPTKNFEAQSEHSAGFSNVLLFALVCVCGVAFGYFVERSRQRFFD
eukprot:c17287_g1_i2.p1 GENE.c17287_g1_i2~~c17287_g1_i2.p1  ORF type:complete len:197 (+),score=31.56 c17287_g1_i2:384-974(+)